MNTLIEINGDEYNISSNSVGRHYIDNVALAINTLNYIEKFELTKFQIEKGIKNNVWPCRGNIKKFKNRIFFIDGAHNESGFKKLELSIEEFLDKNFTLIFGLNKNHDINPVINLIKRFKCKTIITQSSHPKSENIENIEKKLKYNRIDYIKSENSKEALDISLEENLIKIVENLDVNPNKFLNFIQQQDTKDRLKDNTQELINRGGFGSPTFFIEQIDMYFGNDRIQLIENQL